MIRFILAFTAMLSVAAGASTAKRVSPETAWPQVEARKAVVVDVREDDEIKSGKVKGAQVFHTSELSTPAFAEFVKKLPKDKPIYTYCSHGGRADRVAQALRDKGLKASSTGGYKDWVKAGAKTN